MKRIILVVIMALVFATPCFAQEIEPDGLFSLEGTMWRCCWIQVGIGCAGYYIPILCLPEVNRSCDNMAFYEGDVYGCNDDVTSCEIDSYASYMDLPLVSTVTDVRIYSFPSGYYEFGVMLDPSELGVYTGFGWIRGSMKGVQYLESTYKTGIMFKVEDDWTPPATIRSMQPSSGTRGTTLTDVLITCLNTTFQDNPPVEISFDPPDDLTVSNINVISNTEIEFDLEIAVDPSSVLRDVIVTYDDGTKLIGQRKFYVRHIGE